MDTVLLVDGTAVVFRAFFAVKGLTGPDGAPTNAVFGFVRMLEQMIAHVRPTRLAVAFDGGAPKCRLELCPAYKAQRPPLPADMRRQFAAINEFLDLAGIRRVQLERQEADDVLATLAERALAADGDSRVVVATADKDLMQLVGPRLELMAQSKDFLRTGEARVKEKTGVEPGQVVEWLAMVGDVADNIPGVPGVGPKTAAKLLGEFGSLEACYAALDRVEPASLREKLKDARAVTDRNVALMTIDRHLDGVPDAPPVAPSPSPDALRDFFLRLGLHRFAAEGLFGATREAAPPKPPKPPKPAGPVGQLTLF